jgi:hypothetical protein
MKTPEVVGVCLMCALFGSFVGYAFGVTVGGLDAENREHQKATRAGVGCWTVDSQGNTSFYYGPLKAMGKP